MMLATTAGGSAAALPQASPSAHHRDGRLFLDLFPDVFLNMFLRMRAITRIARTPPRQPPATRAYVRL